MTIPTFITKTSHRCTKQMIQLSSNYDEGLGVPVALKLILVKSGGRMISKTEQQMIAYFFMVRTNLNCGAQCGDNKLLRTSTVSDIYFTWTVMPRFLTVWFLLCGSAPGISCLYHLHHSMRK